MLLRIWANMLVKVTFKNTTQHPHLSPSRAPCKSLPALQVLLITQKGTIVRQNVSAISQQVESARSVSGCGSKGAVAEYVE